MLSEKNVRVWATITKEEAEQLELIAASENRSLSNKIGTIIKQWLQEQNKDTSDKD